jgi:hypothetical protein
MPSAYKICIAFILALLANALEDSTASKTISLSLLSAVIIISVLFVAGARSDFCHQSCTAESGKYGSFWLIAFLIIVASFFLWWMRPFRRLSNEQAILQDRVVESLRKEGNIRQQVGEKCLIIISVLISYWGEDDRGYARAGLLQLFGSINSAFRTVINNSPAVAAFNTKFQAMLASCFNSVLPLSNFFFAQLSNPLLIFIAEFESFRAALAVVCPLVRALAEFLVLGLLINNWKICITCLWIGLVCSFQEDYHRNFQEDIISHLGLPGH